MLTEDEKNQIFDFILNNVKSNFSDWKIPTLTSGFINTKLSIELSSDVSNLNFNGTTFNTVFSKNQITLFEKTFYDHFLSSRKKRDEDNRIKLIQLANSKITEYID